MRAIIIAAGQGTRLRPFTDDRPKTMVEVGLGAKRRPILHHQIAAYRAAGVHDIVVIRGYKGQQIQLPSSQNGSKGGGNQGVRLVDNTDFAHNNILESLFCAGPLLCGDVIVSYGDILFHPGIVKGLMGIHTPATLVVDRMWARTYEGRTDHPVEQAELCRINNYGLVSRVGKAVGPDGAVGEFIGLARFGAAVVARMWARWQRALARGPEQPYGTAPSLRRAYLTDMLNEAIEDGEYIAPLGIEGHWREIDTVQDLERAHAAVTW